MNRTRLTLLAAALTAASLVALPWLRDPAGTPSLSARPKPSKTRDPLPAASPSASVSISHTTPRVDPDAWSDLRRRLDEMADRLTTARGQREAAAIMLRWLHYDRAAVLDWLARHAGDQRFDPVVASVAQALIAEGNFADAQQLADLIVDPPVAAWVQLEAWGTAYERGLVTEAELRASGLAPDALLSIASGSHRD